MKGDFSRLTFNAKKHYSKVMMQQGRVQLDADWNEQADITGHFLNAFVRDLIGAHGGPGDSFKVEPNLGKRTLHYDFAIREGHYYVDGRLCENDETCTYHTQPDYRPTNSQSLKNGGAYLVYLDVWERNITFLNDPEIREVALGGPDTATRTKTVWQVKLLPVDPRRLGRTAVKGRKILATRLIGTLKRTHLPVLEARTRPNGVPPRGGYDGLQNQLYRVEIHDSDPRARNATFKWSRDNGSVVTQILEVHGRMVAVAPRPGHEDIPFARGDWVEASDDESELQGRAEPLRRVESVDFAKKEVALDLPPASGVGGEPMKHPLMRRWDQKNNVNLHQGPGYGTIAVVPKKWLSLECGIEISFSDGEYRTGDYWLVPARVASKDVLWPKAAQMPPLGIDHHYCPLATFRLGLNGKITEVVDCRRLICPST